MTIGIYLVKKATTGMHLADTTTIEVVEEISSTTNIPDETLVINMEATETQDISKTLNTKASILTRTILDIIPYIRGLTNKTQTGTQCAIIKVEQARMTPVIMLEKEVLPIKVAEAEEDLVVTTTTTTVSVTEEITEETLIGTINLATVTAWPTTSKLLLTNVAHQLNQSKSDFLQQTVN